MNISKRLATSIADEGINDCTGLLKVIGGSSSITQQKLRKITKIDSKTLNEYLTNLYNMGLLNIDSNNITLTKSGESVYAQLNR